MNERKTRETDDSLVREPVENTSAATRPNRPVRRDTLQTYWGSLTRWRRRDEEKLKMTE